MSKKIEDYALVGDCHSCALIAKDGSVDWLCLPRFDSAACLASLLGDERNGRWLLSPESESLDTTRGYIADSFVLKTRHETATGCVEVTDFMPIRANEDVGHLIRIVDGVRGSVQMHSLIKLRLDYGSLIPWVTALDGEGVVATLGPDCFVLRSDMIMRGEEFQTTSSFLVDEGERVVFSLSYSPSHLPLPNRPDAGLSLSSTLAYWEDWAEASCEVGRYTPMVRRSLGVLKALTYAPTGGIIAAPTTSLPEKIGGSRNWDYRYCWLRDSALTLVALINGNHLAEARAWRAWARRTVTGDPTALQIMYGLSGERRLDEREIDTLPGYENSKPVRIGNAAADQLQLDVFGQLMGMVYFARAADIEDHLGAWPFEKKILLHLEEVWQEPDCGIWEFRKKPRHFTFSKLMVWTAFTCGIEAVESFGLEGPVERWRSIRDEIHTEICTYGYDEELGAFVQSYGSAALDASLLLMSIVGFLPPTDQRIIGTIAAIQAKLTVDGFVLRYRNDESEDGLPDGEGAFLACSFWLVDALRLQGRIDEATALFDRLAAVANDVGLLAEEYDPVAARQLGNFPQAFSHVSLVNSAVGLHRGNQAPLVPLFKRGSSTSVRKH